MFLPALLLLTATSPMRVTVIDSAHTRLSRIIETTISEELRARSVEVGEGGEFTLEIVDVSDAGGKGRTSQQQLDMTHSVAVTEVVGAASADVELYDSKHNLRASYKLSGSGSSSAAVGSANSNVFSAFIIAPLFRRTRSADAARAIGHDIAASVAAEVRVSAPVALDTPRR
jgi:hypothetical protein